MATVAKIVLVYSRVFHFMKGFAQYHKYYKVGTLGQYRSNYCQYKCKKWTSLLEILTESKRY